MNNSLVGTYKSKYKIVDLGRVLPINEAIFNSSVLPHCIYYSLDNAQYFPSNVNVKSKTIAFNNLVTRYLKFDTDCEISVYKGVGFVGKENHDWTDLFVHDMGWCGGDGFFTFNLKKKERMDLKNEEVKTLCVFGDTFINTIGSDGSRLDSLLMPNNSYSIIDGLKPKKDKIQFFVKQDEKGHYMSYLVPNNDLAFDGTMASNLVRYTDNKTNANYLSAYNPKENIEITFNFNKLYQLSKIKIINYLSNDQKHLEIENRGIKNLKIYYRDHGEYKLFKKAILNINSKKSNAENKIDAHLFTDSIKFEIPNEIALGNYGGANGNEGLYGLNKVYFYLDDNSYLRDVEAFANSEYSKIDKHAWFWLQDGIILDDKFYSLPLVITSDLTQPDGFQFKVEGVSMIKLDINSEEPNFNQNEQKLTNLLSKHNEKEFLYGCSFLDNREEDGFIYIYGYSSSFFEDEYGKRLIVARVQKEDFENINEWKYFDGKNFVSEMEKSFPLLDHVSCENSVFKNGNEYICIFTYNVKSKYIAYSLSKTPYGPFSDIRIAYVCDEKICDHLYQYNAKGHLHLSKKDNILVSYNVNTSNFDENIKYSSVYGPRFINLVKEGEEDEN